MTIPILKIKVLPKPVLKGKMDVRFPAKVAVEEFLTVARANGVFTFGVDYTKLTAGPVSSAANAYIAVLDQATGVYRVVSLASLLTSGLDADLQAIAALTGTGILGRTADDTWALRTVTGTANEITVTNGDGVAGAPTVSLPDALTFTGKTVTGGTFTGPAISSPTGIVKGDVGLGNVDNTSDANKPVSTATQTALDLKANTADLGTAAAANTTDFATSAQGAAADSAVQPGDLGALALKDKAAVSDIDATGTASSTTYLRGDGSWTTPAGGGGAAFYVADRTALKALDTASVTSAYLAEGNRAGIFNWLTGDFSAEVTADTTEGIYVAPSSDSTGASGAWVRGYNGRANVKWFGAMGDNSTADLAALQATTDVTGSAYIPDGTYKISGPWLVDDYCVLEFESRNAILLSSSTDAIVKPRGHTTTRNYSITIYSGTLEGSGTSGPTGLLMRSASMVKVYGTLITLCGAGVENGGSSSQGAFYNDFFGVDITSCTTGMRNGTLGNEIHMYGGRIADVVVATDDDDNSGVLYSGVAIETFTNSGHRLANSGSACVDVRSIGCRFENPTGNSSYNSAVGVRVSAAAQDTSIISPGFTTVATNISDVGVRTQVLFAEDWNQFAGGTRFKTKKRVTVNSAVASLAAGTGRQQAFTISGMAPGDAVSVVLPASWPANLLCAGVIASSGQVYLQLWNPTASAISLSAADFTFEWTDYT